MTVTAPQGFVATGIACGIKGEGRPDLALVATADRRPVPTAATFTASHFAAPPVQVTRHHLGQSAGHAAAVILNSGNANAGTGQAGRDDASTMCAFTANNLGVASHEVLVCSTGLIGNRLPLERITTAVPDLVDALSPTGGIDAATAIMTTDTVVKETVVSAERFTVGGMAKGAAMLAPNMATMLAVLTTDAEVGPDVLGSLLRDAVAGSFNRLSVDGCQSTNDTVIVLASGRAGAVEPDDLGDALASACGHLARQMAADAEGATKTVTVKVVGASSDAEAERGARQIADSNLCKCSWYGRDPYWGRLAAELGVAGIEMDADRLSVSYGGIEVCRGGVDHSHDAAALVEVMAARDIEIVCDLGVGSGQGWILTNDLTHGYVDENMGTS